MVRSVLLFARASFPRRDDSRDWRPQFPSFGLSKGAYHLSFAMSIGRRRAAVVFGLGYRVKNSMPWEGEGDLLAQQLHAVSGGLAKFYPNQMTGLRESGLPDEQIVIEFRAFLDCNPQKGQDWKSVYFRFRRYIHGLADDLRKAVDAMNSRRGVLRECDTHQSRTCDTPQSHRGDTYRAHRANYAGNLRSCHRR
jgi:hypothetical protein